MNNHFKAYLYVLIGGVLMAFSSACVSPKSITYFNNLPDTAMVMLDTLKAPDPIIMVNDVLDIKVGGESEKMIQYINQYFGGAAGTNSQTGLQYTVDVDGNIFLPVIGKIRVAGLTRDQTRDSLNMAYKKYLVEPIVSVRFGGFRFSVLGEVRNPGTYTTTNEKVSIFEAVSLAGDITSFGHFENVKIIRDINGKRSIKTLNLNDKKILNSEDYYIKRYDIIYVQARSLKSVTENFSRTATFVATITSVLGIFLVLFKK